MKNKAIALGILLVFLFCGRGYCFNWRELHDRSKDMSIKRAEELVKESPDSIETLYTLALTYLNEHKDSLAENIFNTILMKDPSSFEAEWGRAEIFRRRKEKEKSRKILNKIIKEHPDFSPAYITMAYLEYTEGNFNKAVWLTSRVKEQGRDNVDLNNYTRAYLIYAGSKGMIASRGGPISKLINGTQVLPNLKKAEDLMPDSPEVLYGLGSFYFLAPGIAGGNINKALDCLKKVIELKPDFAEAYVRLAQVYKEKNDNKKYETYLSKALELDPENELALDEQLGVCKFNCVTVKEE